MYSSFSISSTNAHFLPSSPDSPPLGRLHHQVLECWPELKADLCGGGCNAREDSGYNEITYIHVKNFFFNFLNRSFWKLVDITSLAIEDVYTTYYYIVRSFHHPSRTHVGHQSSPTFKTFFSVVWFFCLGGQGTNPLVLFFTTTSIYFFFLLYYYFFSRDFV